MNECYSYLLLLSFLSSLSQTISIHLPNVTIQHVCEHELLAIRCFYPNESIDIVRSMYGRTSQRICNDQLTHQVFYKTCANIEQSKKQTKLRCQGKSTCEVLIDNTIYTDPCGSTIPKHFEIHYRCLNLEKICLEVFENCSKMKDLKCLEEIQEKYSCACPASICEYNQANQLIGFREKTCVEEVFQGIHWPKTFINKGQQMPCPSPCTGQIFRFCQMNNRWAKPNTSDCQCPMKRFDQSSMHHVAHSFIFECNFWLINRLWPRDKKCIFETDDQSMTTCLLSAFEKMSMTSCATFSIDFKNIGFEIFIPKTDERKFRLPTVNANPVSQFGFNQIIVDKTDTSYVTLPLMFIDTKRNNSTPKSLILVEQSHHFNSIQTGNVTVIFHHQSSEFRYQCRAYRSSNTSFQLDSSDMFFVCQFLCSNGSHLICQCPFYNPVMHYVLHLDTSIPKDDLELSIIENDFEDKCSIEHSNRSIEQFLKKIDSYLSNFTSFKQKKNLAQKLLSFLDLLIVKDNQWLNQSFQSTWNRTLHLIEQMEFLAFQLIDIPGSFRLIRTHLEFFVNTQEFESADRSITISSNDNANFTFFILSKLNEYLNVNQSLNHLNSHIIHLNTPQKFWITFRHLNLLNISNQISTCVSLKQVWSTEGCYLVSSNSTHSICTCDQPTTLAVLRHFQKSTVKSHGNHLSFVSKIGSVVSIICLILTIITLILHRCLTMNDDLLIVRNILHINMSICLLIVQFLFLFGIDQMKYKFVCRISAILLHYFLLATLSWMFVDGIELIIALKHLFKVDRIRILAYSLYAYAFPLLITILSISLSTHGNYSNKHCWFADDNPFIWAFGIPFLLLILANLCFFFLSISIVCKDRKASDRSQRIRSSLRNISTLAILFASTWLIALFYLHEQSPLIFSYAFTILNFFQGLFVFISYCLSEKIIQDFYLHPIFNVVNKPIKEGKANQHYNTSSSGYSSAQSSEINKLDHRSSFRTSPEYLSSMPIGLLSTFRYPASDIPVTPDQNEQLLKRSKIDFHHQHDDHQYYEIG